MAPGRTSRRPAPLPTCSDADPPIVDSFSHKGKPLATRGCMTVVVRLRGEGILPLFFCGEGASASNRGQDARDTQGRDALPTGLRDGI